ncbi:MAG: DUF4238 domain-containing protein [Roseiarcus sp.]
MSDASTPSNAPRRNHYIPEFYLRRWAGQDGRVCQFARPSKAAVRGALAPVKALRRHPSQTGFEVDLYALNSIAVEGRAYLEEKFFKLVDQEAADALTSIETNTIADLSSNNRSGWARFIISLIHRHPEKIEALRGYALAKALEAAHETEAGRAVREKYKNSEKADETVARLVHQAADINLANSLAAIIDSENVGNHLIQMRWSVLTVTEPTLTFLTSDRPVVMSDGVNKPDSYIIVAIGPSKAFFACNSLEMERYVHRIPWEQIMQFANDIVVRQACNFVYGFDDSQLQFVESRLGKQPAQFIAGKVLLEKRKRS